MDDQKRDAPADEPEAALRRKRRPAFEPRDEKALLGFQPDEGATADDRALAKGALGSSGRHSHTDTVRVDVALVTAVQQLELTAAGIEVEDGLAVAVTR
jgi:hypothetical protein